MARIIYGLGGDADRAFQVYTDLDFWDARRILKDLAVVKRNFRGQPPGDEFPTKVSAEQHSTGVRKEIERRLRQAIASPPRHVIVTAMLRDGCFEFDPQAYFPARWSLQRMLHFTRFRLPLDQPALSGVYWSIALSWRGGRIRVERVQRDGKFDPAVGSEQEARRRLRVPSCF